MAQSLIDILIRTRRQGQNETQAAIADLKSLDSAAGMLSQGLAGLAAGAGIAGIVALGRELDELARRGAVFEQIGSVLKDFAASVGESSDAMIAAAQRGAQGTISQYELILNANKAIQFGVARSAEDFGKLVELATALGRSQGLTDTFALESLINGIARESPRWLDNLGIFIQSEQAMAAYADTIGKTADQLTNAERKQALLVDAFAQGAVAMEANRAAADSAATQFERLGASSQDLKDILGLLIAQNSAGFIKSLADATSGAVDVLRGEGDLPDWWVALGAAIQGAGESMSGATTTTAVLAQVLQVAGIAMQGLDESTRQGRSAFDEATDAFMEMEGMVANAGTALQMASNDMAETGRSAVLAAIDVGALSDSLAKLAGTSAGAIVNAAKNVAGIVGSEKAKELAAQQLRYLQEQTRELEKQGVTGLDLVFAMNDINTQSLSIFENIEEADRAAQRAAAGGVSAMKKAAQEAEQQFESLKGKVAGVLSGALDPGVGVNPDDILAGLGLREDAINENARRLADVAVNGFKSPWAQYLNDQFPDLFKGAFAGSESDLRAAAASALKNFQDGLDPSLIDKDAAKERVRRMLIGEARMDELAKEIAGELASEFGGVSQERIAALATGALGGGGLFAPPSAEGFDTSGASAAEAFASGARGVVVDGNLGGQITSALDEQLRAESNLSRLTEGGRLSGAAWGSGFLETVQAGLPTALIDLLTQVLAPGMEAALIQRATLQGAR